MLGSPPIGFGSSGSGRPADRLSIRSTRRNFGRGRCTGVMARTGPRQGLLDDTATAAREDRAAANEPGDLTDPAEPLTAEEIDDAVAAGIPNRVGTENPIHAV